MLRLVAREGLGLAVVPSIVVRHELAAGVLVELARLPRLSEIFYAMPTPRPLQAVSGGAAGTE